ncbi:Gfo/Idh/MocA family oxidoreductase [uncultured Acetobacteroides sp.]|uniref:Gfo/Idh/MocA family protein n=1 Tax=uncultured Acetobacteroides sp. TaxID=1760811 RepID=UPI0029F5217E|nr:Gfo/Idh/MocA family oxidoreductase [uncultured Acetobacteroides sp.]
MDIVRWGIIGCGDVCEVKSGPAFYKSEHSELVAVMRRDAAKAKDFAQRHHVAQWYTSAEELLANSQIDAVYIATPPSMHCAYTLMALKADKAVYVEKPMALTYSECMEMVNAAKEVGKPLFVAHYRRALPYFVKVKELVECGAVGKPLTVRVEQLRVASESDIRLQKHTWRINPEVAGGGYLYDLAPHTIDILDFILGRIADVHGFAVNLGKLYSAEDTVAASFLFESGVLGTASWSFVAAPQAAVDSIEIVGTRGKITFSTFEFTPIVLQNGDGLQTFDFEKPQHIQQPLIQTIVDELLGKGECPSKGEVAARPSWFFDKIFGRI